MGKRTSVVITVVALALGVTVGSSAGGVASGRVAAACQQGRLPDRGCTPGATFHVSAGQVCVPGYSKQVRYVPGSESAQVYAEYGIRSHERGQYEVDHLIALELGGNNSIRNLWPERANPRPGFHEKDSLENTLHRLVCAGRLSLRKAQSLIATNWLAAFKTYVRTGTPTAPTTTTTPTATAPTTPTAPTTATTTVVPYSCPTEPGVTRENDCPPPDPANPPTDFCTTHSCIASFWNGRGTAVQCNDGEWSKSGGISGACSYHGGLSSNPPGPPPTY